MTSWSGARRASAAAAAVMAGLLLADALAAVAPRAAHAADPAPEGSPIMLIVDVSGSMGENDGTGRIKIEGAKSALLNFLGGLEPASRVGLWTYPAKGGSGCNNGERRFAVEQRDPAAMSAEIRSLRAGGDTPTAEALKAAAADLRNSGYQGGTVILVSDGEHTCADPCEAARQLRAQGLDIQVITIAFQTSDRGREELRCIASATGGVSLDAADSAKLKSTLDQLSRPRLTLDLDYPRSVVADVGVGPDGLVPINATVRSTGQLTARSVVARLRFDLGSAPGVSSPVRSLGNLEAGQLFVVVWRVRPGLILVGKTLSFSVVVKANNLAEDVSARGSFEVKDGNLREHAGPLLRDARRIAIMGDSYSSGEGAHSYLAGTDTSDNACHRSHETYLVQTFSVPDELVLACSGAIAEEVMVKDTKNHVDSQIEQLRKTQKKGGPVDAIAMTMGGNNAGFETLAETCVFHSHCEEHIGDDLASVFVSSALHSMTVPLTDAYFAIDAEINSSEMLRRRGHAAPIIVLAYPRPIPGSGRGCFSLIGLTPEEVNFANSFITQLNGYIEGLVQATREMGVPVYFVAGSEDAFLPDHTVCDRKEPYVRGLEDFLRDPELATLVAALALGPNTPIEWGLIGPALRALGRGRNELLHPNPSGYAAMTRAVIRWSLTPEGREAARPPRDPRRIPASTSWRSSEVNLGQLDGQAAPVLQGGTVVPLQVDSFAPGTSLHVAVQSEPMVVSEGSAGPDGRALVAVPIPRQLAAGRHDIVASGTAPDGRPRKVEIPFEVPGSPFPWVLLVPLTSTLALAAGLVLRRGSRRVVAA